MKKTLTRFLGFLMCTLMIVSSMGAFTAGTVIASGNTVYVSDSGDDTNAGTSLDKPVKTLGKATALAGTDGTVIVTDTVNVGPSEQIPGAKITGLNSNSVINVTGWAMRLSGPTTIENITLNAKAAWSYILAQGNKLVIGEGVKVTADEGINTALSIRGGGDGAEIAKSCEVVIKSGIWKNYVGGTRNKDTKGNAHVTIYDTATVSSITLGNENAKDVESYVTGSSTLKLVGKTNPVPGNIGASTVKANAYIDVTEYEGTIPDAWMSSGITVLTDKTKIPADAKPISEGGVVGEAGKTYDTGSASGSQETELTDVRIYLSDNGNDSNDGKTIGAAVKTLARANTLAGKGGTIVVADKYTHGTYDKITAAKLEGFTSDCVFDVAVWRADLGADLVIDNITLNASYNWAFLLCNGKKLTVGENVSCTKSGSASVTLSIRGGAEGTSVNGSTDITLKGGTWAAVYGGTKEGNVSGNTKVTVYPGAKITSVLGAGNDGYVDGNVIAGNGTLKLVGASSNIAKLATSQAIKGGHYLDLSEYSGTVTDAMMSSGYSVIMEEGAIPEYKAPEITAPTTGVPTKVVPGDGVIYISDNGNNSNDGKTPEKAVKTIDNALTKGGANPTIVVVDALTIPNANKIAACTITGLTSDSKLNIGAWAMSLGGKMTIENITIVALVKYSYILAQGNSLTIGENVTTAKGDGVTTLLGIRGGGEGNSINGDTNVVIMSGEWGDVHGGTRNASIYGNTYLTIHEGAKVLSANIGNNGEKEGNVFDGNGVIKLVGKPSLTRITAKPAICTGEMIIDLTEFTGTQDAAWAKTGATIVTDKAQLPAYVTEHFAKASGVYDLSGIENLRYISDSGDDANDGLTKDKPMKSIKAAVNSMGEKGGTVAVVGRFTLEEYTSGLAPFNITSTCEDDQFVFKLWALHTNNTEIYNLNILVAKDYNFILHCGKPLKIGKNVNVTLDNGVKVYPSIRGNESGDVAMTDITIESGSWAAVYTGTKNANILGNSNVTMSGGSATSIVAGNDSTSGRILGSTKITLKGNASVPSIVDKLQCDGYTIVDVSEFKGAMPGIAASITIITEEDATIVPVNKTALFINGYPDGTFLPEKVMTRAEAITVASKIAGLTASYQPADQATAFTDLKADDWYATNVKYLESFGALGFWGITLDASKGITRGEFVKLISGMITNAEGASPTFSDVTEAHPYYNEILRAAKAGLVTGYPDGTFLPDNTLKRSEIVTILNRLSTRNIVAANAAKITRFSDIAGHWAAPQIIAASCESVTDGIIIWQIGENIAEKSPVDKAALDYSTTTAVLAGVDTANAKAVSDAVEAYAVKRRAEIANTATNVNVTGTKYYVSENGDDAKDGKTPETAWKTLSKVNTAQLSEGDGVFFKRGEVFRGQLKTQKGVTYSAYGEGAKPALYGSLRNYSNTGFWLPTNKENVYVSSETFASDVGLIVFNEGEACALKEILNIKGFLGALTTDLQMYHDKNDLKLYLYSTSDPNTRWTSTEIAQGRNGITGDGNNVTIDNLCIKYVGAHGIGYGNGTTGLTVQNCEIGWIGGMLQNTDRVVRYGNGVEIYVGCKDYTITNCHVYQVYDAGITHQYFQTRDEYVGMENIKYTDNVIEYCTYNIEYVNAQPEDKGVMKNVDISGNLLIHGGEGWGQQRSDSTPAVIKGWQHVNNGENCVYYDNVIMTMAEKCHLVCLGVGKLSYMPELTGNLFVAKRGSKFGIYGLRTNLTPVEYNEKMTDTTIGLDDNTLVFVD